MRPATNPSGISASGAGVRSNGSDSHASALLLFLHFLPVHAQCVTFLQGPNPSRTPPLMVDAFLTQRGTPPQSVDHLQSKPKLYFSLKQANSTPPNPPQNQVGFEALKAKPFSEHELR